MKAFRPLVRVSILLMILNDEAISVKVGTGENVQVVRKMPKCHCFALRFF